MKNNRSHRNAGELSFLLLDKAIPYTMVAMPILSTSAKHKKDRPIINNMKRMIGRLIGIVCLATVLVNLPAQGAVDMFLDLGSDIPGESQDKDHHDQVDLLAWSWGMSNSGTTHSGGGGGAGKASFQDINLTKYVDKSTPLLMLNCAKGAHIPKATVYVRKSGQPPIEYIKIVMTDVLVTSVSTGGSGGQDRLTENISLNFAQVEFDYVPTNKAGGADKPILFKWDIAGNVGL